MAAPHDGIAFATAADWEAWLDEHHGDADEAWLKIARKRRGHATVTYAEALEVALCFGWIDAVRNKLDDDLFLQRFTPRARAQHVVEDQPRRRSRR